MIMLLSDQIEGSMAALILPVAALLLHVLLQGISSLQATAVEHRQTVTRLQWRVLQRPRPHTPLV